MVKQYRRGELSHKDMSVVREADIAKVQRDKAHGVLRDYSLNHRVEMTWDLNDEAIMDKMFILKIDDYEVVLDSEEFMRYLRWV